MSGIGCSPPISTRINSLVKALGSCLPAAGKVFCSGNTLASPRKILIVPKVTIKGCKFKLTTSPPLINPQTSPMAIGTKIPIGKTTAAEASTGKFCKAAAPPKAASAITEPTEMSIPPVMITIVTPTAMIA
jgi:hypothetical protein